MVEKEIRATLAQHLSDAVRDIRQFKEGVTDRTAFMTWCDQYEAQIVALATQIMWSENMKAAIQVASSTTSPAAQLQPLERVLAQVETTLAVLADSVLQEQPALRRCKLEHLINEFVHKRTVTR